jgi:hypothetical protein
MTNLNHIMPKPLVIPILWGHDYAENPGTVSNVQKMISDFVTGPFMNVMVQYGVRRGTVHEAIVIDDENPPKTVVYYDANNNLQDDITKKLVKWIAAGLVPAPQSKTDINTLYLILPPPESTFETYNSTPKQPDPIGNGLQGYHNAGATNPGPPPTYFWGIVKTNFNNSGPLSSLTWVSQGVAPTICHELAEQIVDRNGTYREIGDPCLNNSVQYRGWNIQQFYSVWDGNTCINPDNPVSVRRFLQAIGFDLKNGLRSLGVPTINIDYLALKMQSFET